MPLPPIEPGGPDGPTLSEELESARRLYAAHDWTGVARWADDLPRELFSAEPELGFRYADALRRLGRSEEALALADEIEPAVRLHGDHRLLLEFVNVRGVVLFEMGRMAEAESSFGELLDRATEWEDDEFAARAANNLGVLANIRGRKDLALTGYQHALAAYFRLGYERGLAQTHHNLGISYRDLGFDRDADVHFQRAIRYARQSGSEDVVAFAESERALLRARAGDHRLAERLGRAAVRRFEVIGDPLGRADAIRILAAAARAAGRDDLAATRLGEALSIAEAHADPLLRAEVQRDRGLLLRDSGLVAEAKAALLDSADHFEIIGATAESVAIRGIAGIL
jgi:tetratricopeptide (TPR) repeat protein